MITIHEAIYALNPSIKTIRGDVAYDANEHEVTYSKSAAEIKLAELQAKEATQEQTQATAKASALAKLAALGLTQSEVTALIS
jgi:hypothetical protein